jgi:hypothetical protein
VQLVGAQVEDIIPTEVWGEKLATARPYRRHCGRPARRRAGLLGRRARAQLDLASGSYVRLDNTRGRYAAGDAASLIVS